MTPASIWKKIEGRYKGNTSRYFFRRPCVIRCDVPLISFTFDDFPVSAWRIGGAILRRWGVKGTYYAAFGLMDNATLYSEMFSAEDAKSLLDEGHELGCHTFDHLHSWQTKRSDFEASILRNGNVLDKLIPGTTFKTLSYPYSEPSPLNKLAAGKSFLCCRAGHRRPNVGKVDLNGLGAHFLEQYRGTPNTMKELVDSNRRERGWLIFATHDIATEPSRFGCTPECFEDIVRYAVESGAQVLPVIEAFRFLAEAPSGA